VVGSDGSKHLSMISQRRLSTDRTFSLYSAPMPEYGTQAQTHANESSSALPLQAVHLPTQFTLSCDRSRHRAGCGSLSRNRNSIAAPSTLQPRATPERHGRILGAAEPSPPPDRAEPRPVAGRSKVLSAELVREECSTRPFDCSTRSSAAPSACHSLRSCHSSCASRGLDGTLMRTWLQEQGISVLLDGPRSDAAASRPGARVVQGRSS